MSRPEDLYTDCFKVAIETLDGTWGNDDVVCVTGVTAGSGSSRMSDMLAAKVRELYQRVESHRALLSPEQHAALGEMAVEDE